jgi:hypothetical protein
MHNQTQGHPIIKKALDTAKSNHYTVGDPEVLYGSIMFTKLVCVIVMDFIFRLIFDICLIFIPLMLIKHR